MIIRLDPDDDMQDDTFLFSSTYSVVTESLKAGVKNYAMMRFMHEEPVFALFSLCMRMDPCTELVRFSFGKSASALRPSEVAVNVAGFFPDTMSALEAIHAFVPKEVLTAEQVLGKAMHKIGTHHIKMPKGVYPSDVILRDSTKKNICNLAYALKACWSLSEEES